MSKSIQLKNQDNEKMYPHPYYPIGSIYLSINNTNPSKWFGGTWEQIAKGRTLVGVDTSQTEFNIAKKTGGEKTHKLTVNEMPSHQHNILTGARTIAWDSGNFVLSYQYQSQNPVETTEAIKSVGGNQAHNNMPPFFTCYIWCRTA